jgi:hypothetical protein
MADKIKLLEAAVKRKETELATAKAQHNKIAIKQAELNLAQARSRLAQAIDDAYTEPAE